jgi:serine/threonine-protein kinase
MIDGAQGAGRPAADDPAPGAVVAGIYRLERLLKRDSIGACWLARDRESNTPAALHIISPKLVRNEPACRQFIQDADSCFRLAGHSNILSVIALKKWEGRVCIVTEHLQGPTLREAIADALREGHTLDWAMAADVAAQTLAALGHAHRRQVIHLGLKPSNIMLLPGLGVTRRVVVADFGLARLREEAHKAQAGEMFQDSPYASPEKRADPSAADQRADLYSVGVIVYEMLAGCPPAVFGSESEIRFPPNIPREVRKWISRAIEKDPKDRFASADQMAEALGRIAVQEPQAQPSEEEPVEHPGRPKKEEKVPEKRSKGERLFFYGGTILVFLALLGLLALLAPLVPRGTQPPAEDESPAAAQSDSGESLPELQSLSELPAPAAGD